MQQTETGSWIYSLTVDPDFLYGKKTIYPVHIDPSVTISGSADQFDTYAALGTPNTNYYNGVKMYVGKDSSLLVCRGFVNFDLTDLTNEDAYMVTNATYHTQEYLGYTSTCYIRIYQVTEAWTSSTLKWSNQPDIDTSTIIDSVLVNGAGNYTFDVTTLVENWFLENKGAEGYAQNGFVMMSDREGSIVLRQFRSSDSSVSPPYLTVDYTEVDRTAPNPPTGLTMTYIKNSSYNGTAQLKLNWTAATDLPTLNGAGIKEYRVTLKRQNGSNWDTLISDAVTTNLYYQTSAYYDDNSTYRFYIKAVDNATEVNGTGIYNQSAEVYASLAVPDCEKPTIRDTFQLDQCQFHLLGLDCCRTQRSQ